MQKVTEAEYAVLVELFTRYRAVSGDSVSTAPKCDAQSLQRLCDEAIRNGASYPSDKMHRWLGFVQGVLAAQGLIDVDVERDYTRPLFHSLYGEPVKSFSSSD